MNLLMVAPYLPAPSWGASTRSYYLLQALAREHTVSLLALSHDSATETFDTPLQEIKLKRMRQVPSTSSIRNKRVRQLLSAFSIKSYLMDLYYSEEAQKELDLFLSQDS